MATNKFLTGDPPTKKSPPINPIDPNTLSKERYKSLYEQGRIATYDEASEAFQPPVLQGVDIVAKKPKSLSNFKEKYSKKLSDTHGSSLISSMFMLPVDAVAGLPQAAMTYLLDSESNLEPSKALGIENKWGALAADVVLDPTNLVGAGLAGKVNPSKLLRKATRLGHDLSPINQSYVKRLENLTLERQAIEGLDYDEAKYILEKVADKSIDRLSSPEGVRRARNLVGDQIGKDDLPEAMKEIVLDQQAKLYKKNIKRVDVLPDPETRNNASYQQWDHEPDSPALVKVGMNFFPKVTPSSTIGDLRRTVEHELAHSVQHRTGPLRPTPSMIDKRLKGLELRSDLEMNYKVLRDAVKKSPKLTDVKAYVKSPEDLAKIPELALSKIANEGVYLRNSKNYFLKGSKGKEKYPFLAEAREDMVHKGLINHAHDPISPELVEKHYRATRNPFHDLRIYDIMKDKPKNFKLLADEMNKMPALLPVAGAAALGASQTKENSYATGGPVQPSVDKVKNQVATAYVDSNLKRNKDLEWVKRLYDPNTPNITLPGETSPSTHYMESGDNLVYPTVVNKGNGLEYLGDNAYDYATQTNTAMKMNTSTEANWMARNYKRGTNVLTNYATGGTINGGPNDPPLKSLDLSKTSKEKYKELYDSGRLATYDQASDTYQTPALPEVSISAQAPKSAKDFFNRYGKKKTAETTSLAQAMFTAPAEYLMGLPQAATTYLLDSEKNLEPSKALGVENPWAAMAVDMVADPTNLVGAGLLGKGKALRALAAPKEAGILSSAYKVNTAKASIANPLELLDNVIPKPLTPGNLLGMDDGWANYSPLNLVPGYGKKLKSKPSDGLVGFRKFGSSLDDVIDSQSLRPNGSGMGSKQIKGEGNWAEPGSVNENYPGVFEATMNPQIEGSNIKLERIGKRRGIVGTTKEGDTAIPLTDTGLSFNRRLPFSNRYVPINKEKLINNKFQFATVAPHLQNLAEKYAIWTGVGAAAAETGFPGLHEANKKYIIEPTKQKFKDLTSKYETGGPIKPLRNINRNDVKNFEKTKLEAVQLDLKNKGLYKGKVDGIYGPLTEAAIESYNLKHGGIRLPEFNVVSTNDPSKVETLAALEAEQRFNNKPNMYNTWDKSGKPKIEISNNIRTRAHYNPLTNTATVGNNIDLAQKDMYLEDEKMANIFMSNPRGARKQLEDENLLEYDHWGTFDGNYKIAKQIYAYPYHENNVSGYKTADTDIVAELSHGIQDKNGQMGFLRGIKDWTRNPYVSNAGYRRQYDTPGTAEYEAHTIIEPALDEYSTRPSNTTIDVGRHYPKNYADRVRAIEQEGKRKNTSYSKYTTGGLIKKKRITKTGDLIRRTT